MPIDLPPPESRPPAGAFDVPVATDSPTSFSSTTATPAARTTATIPPRKRPLVVILAIGSAALVSLLAMAVLYYKWSGADEFNNTIIVWGEDAWTGSVVKATVTGHNLPDGGLSGELTEKDHMMLRFHVPPGEYLVRVWKDGTLIEQARTIPALTTHTFWWPFRQPPAVTQTSKPK